MLNRNPAALDPCGFKGSGFYNLHHPSVPYGHRLKWAERSEHGEIALRDEPGGLVTHLVGDDQFREARDWPTPIGQSAMIVGSAVVQIGGVI